MRLETTLVGSFEANEFLRRVRANTSVKAVARSINDAIQQGKTTWAREINNELNLPKKYANKGKRIRVLKTNRKRNGVNSTRLQGSLRVTQRDLSAFRFLDPKLQKIIERRLSSSQPGVPIPFRDLPGVLVKYRRSGSPQLFPGTFVLASKYKSNTGKPNFLIGRRKGRERLPIDTLYGTDLYTAAKNPNAISKVKSKYVEAYQKRFKYWNDFYYAKEIAKLKRRGKITVR